MERGIGGSTLQTDDAPIESLTPGSTLQTEAAPIQCLTPGSSQQADTAPSKNLSPDQLMYLENIIHFQGRLTPERREDLAKELNVDERAIKQWVRMTRDYPFFY
ncbi:unnamed protein product [Lymnaea stagnalis]|uniref:Homeobox domain-containing protein n=1 Tax=Lymnaea stagnalis TaxID=6523 RepID=A0AAV2IM48_LYMST